MLLNGGSYNQPHVATLKVVVHVPIKRYGMLWGFQSLHMNDGWMDGWYPSLKERKEGREGGRVPRVTIHNPKLHNSKEKPTWGDFPTPLGVGRRIGQPCSLSVYSYCKIVGLFVEKDAIVKVEVYIYEDPIYPKVYSPS